MDKLKTELTSDAAREQLHFHQLDIADDKSIEKFTNFLKNAHPDGVDILINNAVITPEFVRLKYSFCGTLCIISGVSNNSNVRTCGNNN